MKILVSYTRFPWPTIRGDQLTVWKLVEFLSRRHEVTLLCSPPEKPADLDRLPSGIARLVTVRNPMPLRLARIARALGRGTSLQVESFFSGNFAQQRSELLRSGAYDLVYSHYLRSYGSDDFDAHGACKVIGLQLSHQAHFAKAAAKERNPVKRYLYHLEYRRLVREEVRIAAWNDLVHLISEKDVARIHGVDAIRSKIFINPHGVETEHFVPRPERRISGRLVFTGNLRFQANEDALLWFLADIWPRISAAVPRASFVAAGAAPASRIQAAMAAASNATLIENPPDMAEVICTADVAIDPLRIGAGLQNKVLEALSCGVPMVATTLANEGIRAPSDCIALADDAGDFAEATIRLLRDPSAARSMGAVGRKFIEAYWTWDYFFTQLEDRWLRLVEWRRARQA